MKPKSNQSPTVRPPASSTGQAQRITLENAFGCAAPLKLESPLSVDIRRQKDGENEFSQRLTLDARQGSAMAEALAEALTEICREWGFEPAAENAS